MPPKVFNRSQSSDFGAAAQVLFNSAQKIGAVKPLDKSTVDFAKQLKKIQTQSKKQGGSLGSVSYRVAEFVAAQQRIVPDVKERIRANKRTTATVIPVLPIPVSRPTEATPEVPKSEPRAAAPVKRESPKEKAPLPLVDIAEDKPLFTQEAPRVVAPQADVFAKVSVSAPEPPLPVDRRRPEEPAPVVGLAEMVGGVGTAQRQQQQPFSDEGSISVNAWEQQREREVDRLRMKQAEAERERAAERLVAEHRSLGLEWIQRRSRSFPSTKLEKGKEQLAKIYFSKSADDSLDELSRLAESGGSRSSSLHSTMALCIARQIREVDEAHRAEKFEKLEALLRQMKVPTDVITKSNMIAFHDEKFEAALGNLSQSSLGDLDAALVRKVSLHYLDKGLWEDAISVIEKNRNHLEEKSGFQYLLLLKKCRFLDSPAKENTMAYAVKRLNELGRLGMEAKLYLALCETGTARKSTLMQLIDSSDATEVVYGELLKRCNPDDIPSVLEKMAKNGLDKEDPHILTALAYRAIDEHDPLAVFREIEQHTQNSPVVPGQLKAATRSAELFPSEEVLSLLVALLKRSSPASSYCVVFRVFALLYDQQRFDLILELYEHFKTEDNANFLNRFPNTVAFINAALIDKRLPPLSDLKPSDVDYRKAITGVAKEKESSTDSKDHLTSIIEKMLAYAKEKQWEEALKTLDTLQGLQAENDAALTLIYNCALSASVELPAVTLNTFDVMKARGVVCKPTTINTVLSSLSKSGDWKESLRFYESANSTEKDITTYLVLFSLLSKYNLWESAFSAYEDMRKSFNKPSSTVFNLAIGATNGNWSVMLKVFYDMLKVHGASVKENVLQQVVHTLEQNNRTSELVALEKEMKKKKKKK